MLWFFLFVFGIAIGSFVNVIATRYDGERFLLSMKTLGGRSHCTHCHATLEWYELIPLVSFVIQGGRCRRCKTRLSLQYPIVELISGLIFLFIPLTIPAIASAAFWIIVFELLLLMTLIDIELGIIPDELCIFLGVLGIVLAIDNNFVSRLIGALFAGAFFGFLILVTRGKGMGMGDLKLAIPLGLLFGWPIVTVVLVFAFLTGAIVGLASIALHKNTMKGILPFGPFLAVGAAIVFFWGPQLITWYLSILGVQ